MLRPAVQFSPHRLSTLAWSPARRRARYWLAVALVLSNQWLMTASLPVAHSAEVLPRHVTPEVLQSVRKGLDFLARTQGPDGGWHDSNTGEDYTAAMTALAGMAFLAAGNTPTRGRYAPQVEGAINYLLSCATSNGVISSPGMELSRPMHSHGFALLFLASAYGSTTKPRLREAMRVTIEKAVTLTAKGQSKYGGWTYTPGGGDEGSVTVTQVQALRAAHNAGFRVPPATIDEAVRYIGRCETPEGGIEYALGSGTGPRLAISCAAVATLYNAGEYDGPIALRCLDYVWGHFHTVEGWSKGGGHDFYSHLYAAQAFYMAGDKYWDVYFPSVRDDLIKMQDKSDGAWQGDFVGKSYGTSIALVILQLPYKYLPVYQR